MEAKLAVGPTTEDHLDIQLLKDRVDKLSDRMPRDPSQPGVASLPPAPFASNLPRRPFAPAPSPPPPLPQPVPSYPPPRPAAPEPLRVLATPELSRTVSPVHAPAARIAVEQPAPRRRKPTGPPPAPSTKSILGPIRAGTGVPAGPHQAR